VSTERRQGQVEIVDDWTPHEGRLAVEIEKRASSVERLDEIVVESDITTTGDRLSVTVRLVRTTRADFYTKLAAIVKSVVYDIRYARLVAR